MKSIYKLAFMISSLLIVCILGGCADSGSHRDNEYLIRLGDRVVTVFDFTKAFEISKTAYSYDIMKNPRLGREAQLRLLNQMTEEMILLERAKELQIYISDSELEESIADIKADYPEGVFEETLLEHAVSYHSWKEGLKNRLIKEKVISEELEANITITHDDISKYYKEHYGKEGLQSGAKEGIEDKSELIIKNLRRKKAEEAYTSWIKDLQTRYTIEINRVQWEKIFGL